MVTRIISGAETSPPQDHHYGPVAIQQPDQIDDKKKTRPGVQQCQAQGLVFCPLLGSI